MKEIKAYQCDHCKFYKKTKSSAINHEENCYHNPKNRACATCEHNIIDYETIYDPNHGGNPGSTDYEVPYNYCKKKEVVLNRKTLKMNCMDWKRQENK